MAGKKVELTFEAMDDLDEIYLSIEKHSPKYAFAWAGKFFEKIALLENFNRLGRVVPEINLETIRELILDNYRIIYEIRKGSVVILMIRSSKKPLNN